jgi:DNA ligase D-like protein (predicted polymerase)
MTLQLAGRDVVVTNPDKVFFPERGYTKLDLVNYYLAVADGALCGVQRRPMVLKRFVNGATGEAFFQKRAPNNRPPWLETAEVRFPSGRTADLIVCDEPAGLAWAANLGCIDLNPWPVRVTDVDHPDELRVDLDPTPEAGFDQVRRTALLVRDVLEDYGYVGYPKTSGSRGIHIYVRIEPRWEFTQVRRAALALGREVERRGNGLATTAWWKEERHGVFLDYNQNARDRTIASAYSVRPLPDARVSYPLRWDDVAAVEPADFTLATVPALFAQRGDAAAAIDDVQYSLEPLLEVVERHEREGLGEAPYPPHFPKAADEPIRAQPSKRRARPSK